MNQTKYPKLHNFNDMYTPPKAIDYIEPYLSKDIMYWEACYGKGHLAEELVKRGFKVVGYTDMDCLKTQPDEWDIWITNPPFNGNKKFIARAIELGKPFIFLIRLEHLGGVEALRLLGNIDFKIIIPEKRINYLTGKAGKTNGSPFHSIFLTSGIDLKTDKQIVYQKLETHKKQGLLF